MAADTIALRGAVEKAEQVLKMKRDELERLGVRLTDQHQEVQALDANLAALDAERKEHLEDHPKELVALRATRRQIVEERDDLTTEMTLQEGRVGDAQALEVEALARLHRTKSLKLQAEGSAVAAGMRKSICELEQGFDRWLALAREDQQSKDMLVGIPTENSSNLPTYSWSTALDVTFAETIRETIRRKDRAESELYVREQQTIGVG